MPYEYMVLTQDTMMGPEIIDMLNEMGADDWRLIWMEHAEKFSVFYFERKIAINEKLRAIQLGKEIETDDKKRKTTDQD